MNKLLLSSMSLAFAISLNATVFATVDGENITEKDMAPLLQGLPAGFHIDQLPNESKKDLIDKAIQFKLLTKEAIKSGIEKDEDYKRELEVAKNTLALRVWQFKEFQKVKVEDKEIKDFYDRNKEKFVEPEQIHVKHVLVKDEKEAKDIIASLKDVKGADLESKVAEIAKEKSIEPAAKQSGGDLGWVDPNGLVKPFADAAKELKKGEYSKTPVKTEFGYHVILKLDSKDKKQLSVDEVKDYIESILKEDKYKINVESKAKDLQSKAKVEYKVDLKPKSEPKTEPKAK